MGWFIFFMVGLLFLVVEIFSIANQKKIKQWSEEKTHPKWFLTLHFFIMYGYTPDFSFLRSRWHFSPYGFA